MWWRRRSASHLDRRGPPSESSNVSFPHLSIKHIDQALTVRTGAYFIDDSFDHSLNQRLAYAKSVCEGPHQLQFTRVDTPITEQHTSEIVEARDGIDQGVGRMKRDAIRILNDV